MKAATILPIAVIVSSLPLVSCQKSPEVTSWPTLKQRKIGQDSEATLEVTWRKDVVYYRFGLVTDPDAFRQLKRDFPISHFTIRWSDATGATALEQRVNLLDMKAGELPGSFEFTGHFPYQPQYPKAFASWDFDFTPVK